MNGSRSGSITKWDPPGQGLIDGVYVVVASENPGLGAAMSGRTPPVPVNFDLDLNNHAIRVAVLAPARIAAIDVAASAEPPAKKKVAKAPGKAAKKKSVRKRVAARKSATRKQRPKSAAKRKRR